MRKGIIAAPLLLTFGTAGAGSEGQNKDDEPVSRQEFYEVLREVGVFEQVDRNGDGIIDKREFREAGLPQEWEEWAGSERRLDSREFYESAFEAYDDAARAVRSFPKP